MRIAILVALVACGDDGAPPDAGIYDGDSGVHDGGAPRDSASPGVDAGTPMPDAGPMGPIVDRTDPQLHAFLFTPAEADAQSGDGDRAQSALLDTRVEPLGLLVVYLHGAGRPTTCGSRAHGEVLAGMGFHVFQPCYASDYGVGNCEDDIGGCRLEAFEGVDHTTVIDIAPPDSMERRIVRGLRHLESLHSGGDWDFFLDGDSPRWSAIVISGISHGASSSGIIGMVRSTARVVMLSGPLDTGQAWLEMTPVTPIDRFFAFTHTGDEQHPGHLDSFEAMMLPGSPVVVDGASPPYDGSHRLVSSADTSDGHGSTQAGRSSPRAGDEYVFMPVWRYLYGAGR
jgi:hypothetical protein